MTPSARVERLVEAARRIQDPNDALGIRARTELASSTGLSPEGVALALDECLEADPSTAEVASLCASVAHAPVAHVLLSANVFTAAHRAIALALAASERVVVRPSRREPEFARLLAEGAPDLFEITSTLAPRPGEHLFAYGSDETLSTLRKTLLPGVVLHAHGSGLGLVVVECSGRGRDVSALARDIAHDVILFDQRGCLSPRLVAVVGSKDDTCAIGEALASVLAEAETRVPRGRMEPAELADVARYRDAVRFAANVVFAGAGWVGVDDREDAPVVVPPVGRHVHVFRVTDPGSVLAPLAHLVAAVAVEASIGLRETVTAIFPQARASRPGRMQRPPFDGAVDRRAC